MFIDHAGLILFPQYRVFRIIGRLAFPIYAYCIAEGFRYTKDRSRYFLRVLGLGLLCQIVYTFGERDIYLGILLTFSLSIALMALQEKTFAEWKRGNFVFVFLYAASVIAVFVLTQFVTVDYGFWGVMLPVIASLFKDRPRRLLAFSLGLLVLSVEEYYFGYTTQIFSLFAMIPLILYNGKPGKYRLKNFFYVFYPAHLVFLYAVDFLLG